MEVLATLLFRALRLLHCDMRARISLPKGMFSISTKSRTLNPNIEMKRDQAIVLPAAVADAAAGRVGRGDPLERAARHGASHREEPALENLGTEKLA